MITVRVVLPAHLRTLAQVDADVLIEVVDNPTIADLLDALESRYPTLRGTIREHESRSRRAYIRYFACGEDLSHLPANTPLPENVIQGVEEFRVIGAISGG